MFQEAGLPDSIFSNKNSNLGKFLCVLQWKMFVYYMAFWSIWCSLWPVGVVYGHLV
jgi:hypothetical protein